MMQTYGFCRIYDAKASGKAAARARTDLALCFAWVLGAAILSPMRFRTSIVLDCERGGTLVTSSLFVGLKYIVIAALLLIKTVFTCRHCSYWRGSNLFSS